MIYETNKQGEKFKNSKTPKKERLTELKDLLTEIKNIFQYDNTF